MLNLNYSQLNEYPYYFGILYSDFSLILEKRQDLLAEFLRINELLEDPSGSNLLDEEQDTFYIAQD